MADKDFDTELPDSEERVFNRNAYSAVPAGFKKEDGLLYWNDQQIELPGRLWGTFLYKEMFIVVCAPDSSMSNFFGFDLFGNKIWVIDPVPHPAGTPAYQFVKWSKKLNTLLTLEGRGEFELDYKTGRIMRQVSGPEK